MQDFHVVRQIWYQFTLFTDDIWYVVRAFDFVNILKILLFL